jgi:predicted ATPase
VINDYISKVKIRTLYVNNFKSLLDLKIFEPNPFTVFVGPNGSGKSNIFEAIELRDYLYKGSMSGLGLFGSYEDVIPAKIIESSDRKCKTSINFGFNAFESNCNIEFTNQITDGFVPTTMYGENFIGHGPEYNWKLRSELAKNLGDKYEGEVSQFLERFSRIFIKNEDLRKTITNNDISLNIETSNLEKILKRIVKNENKKEDILEWLQLFIPEFKDIEIHSDTISGVDTFLIYEKFTKKPFTKKLISDGTYNILALLAAVFQSDEPQFLCIEEPENGLHPFVIKQLVSFFRSICAEKGHYIWLNTHSQTLVSELKPEEIITVWKENGATKIKQHKGKNLYNLNMDEAWLSNALGGGVPW